MTTYAVAPVGGARRLGTRTLRAATRWVLLALYLAAVATVLMLGTRQASYSDLEQGLRDGSVTQVRIENAMGGAGGLVHGELGTASVRLVWQDGWHRSVAEVTQATSAAELKHVASADPPEHTVIGRVDTPLRALSPNVHVEWGQGPGSWTTSWGWELTGRLSLLPMIAMGVFLVVVALGPEPRWATSGAWFWLTFTPLFVLAVPAYLLATWRPADLRRPRVNGWVAFLLLFVVLRNVPLF